MPTATARVDAAAATRGQRSRLVGVVGMAAAAAWRPVSGASSAVHRMLLGVLCAFSAARFLANGWVEALYLAPTHHLTYPWFTWVRPLPAPLMYGVVVAMVPLGVAVAAGYRTRLAAAGYLACFTYCELIDAALYLNHYWYLTLALTLVVAFGLDGRSNVPAAVVWVLRAQVGVVYVMAGLGKLNADWLLRGEPMGMWLAARTDMPVIGPLLDSPGVGLVASWSGMLFDLTIVGWLLCGRSRAWAWAALVVFHVVTWRLFPIGVFPWVMIAGTLVFFPPEWPNRWIRRPAAPASAPKTAAAGRPARWIVGALAVWAVVQVTVPLRHLAVPGDVRWTEEGYYGSFRVMLTEKVGWLEFRVTDGASGESWTVAPTGVLTDWQVVQAASRADLVLAAAHVVADDAEAAGHREVEVRADSFVSFNGRPRQRMIDPDVDLAALSRDAGAGDYVLPLDPPVIE